MHTNPPSSTPNPLLQPSIPPPLPSPPPTHLKQLTYASYMDVPVVVCSVHIPTIHPIHPPPHLNLLPFHLLEVHHTSYRVNKGRLEDSHWRSSCWERNVIPVHKFIEQQNHPSFPSGLPSISSKERIVAHAKLGYGGVEEWMTTLRPTMEYLPRRNRELVLSTTSILASLVT